MRYPVGKLGTKDEFDKFWYSAGGFGDQRDGYYHEGEDINLKSGGDTDLGELLYAVNDGKIVYYHNNSHPDKGFGRHMVLECDTPLGKRWFHYAHCEEITASVKEVKKGDVIGKLGKSGTTYAHLHFAVFKVDPSGLRSGIDTIAKTIQELNQWWQNPFEVLDFVEEKPIVEVPLWLSTLLQELGLTIENEPEIRALIDKARRYDTEVKEAQERIKTLNEVLSEKALEVSMLTDKNQNLQAKVDELQTLYNQTKQEKDDETARANQLSYKVESLEREIEKINQSLQNKDEEIKRLKDDNLTVLKKIPTLKLITEVFVRIFRGNRG
jgi:hypothetical protein